MNEWTRSQNEQFPWQIILVIGWSCKAEKKKRIQSRFWKINKKKSFLGYYSKTCHGLCRLPRRTEVNKKVSNRNVNLLRWFWVPVCLVRWVDNFVSVLLLFNLLKFQKFLRKVVWYPLFQKILLCVYFLHVF